MSLPSRGRGLKLKKVKFTLNNNDVAPFTGAWIEIMAIRFVVNVSHGRSLHGGVD